MNQLVINQLNASHIDNNTDKKLPKNARAVNQLTMERVFIRTFRCAQEAATAINHFASNITNCCRRQYLSCGGFKWEYANE